MEDEKIIDLYWERKDEAIMETQAAYGRQLQTIAQRIVQSYEDAEESVNDTYLAAWRTIPPKRPKCSTRTFPLTANRTSSTICPAFNSADRIPFT